MTNRFNMVCLLVDFCENWPTLRDGRIYCNLDRVGAYTPQYVHVVARIIAELYEYIATPTGCKADGEKYDAYICEIVDRFARDLTAHNAEGLIATAREARATLAVGLYGIR